MSIDKIFPNTTVAPAPQRSSRAPTLGSDQKTGVTRLPLQGQPSAADVVRISATAKEMLQAVHGSSDEESFDQAKVESIRREIAEGRFPIDEDRLARKFRELEEQLGDLG